MEEERKKYLDCLLADLSSVKEEISSHLINSNGAR